MSALLEDKIKEAIYSVRWKQVGNGPSPNYFVSAPKDSVRLADSAVSFLASYIADYITHDKYGNQEEYENRKLDEHSLEMMASYLEDHGYTVSLPD